MSTLTVTNIKATGETASRAVSGVAAAWVNFNGTGTVAVRDSAGVASLIDKGTGSYNVNFTNNMSDGNYAGIATGDGTGVANLVSTNGSSARSNTTVASGFGIATLTNTASADLTYVYLAVHGDLA